MHSWIRLGSALMAGLIVTTLAASAEGAANLPPQPADPSASTPIGGGPYPALMEMEPSLSTHTLYHPADLAAAGEMPLVVWANGACLNAGNSFRWFLSEIASYGYVVIALGPIVDDLRRWPVAMGPVAPHMATASEATSLPPPATHSSQIIDAINWASAQAQNPSSRFYHHLRLDRIAVMGQSCGGAQAIEASADPRVTTTVIWNSGLMRAPTSMGGGKALTKKDLESLHAPTAYISGDDEDIAFVNANEDYDYIQKLPVLRAYGRGILHGGTYADRYGGEFGAIAVAWLNWQLKGDARAKKMFLGADCGLCVNPRWVVKSKNLQ